MASVTLWLNEIVNVIHILEVRRPIAPMKKPPLSGGQTCSLHNIKHFTADRAEKACDQTKLRKSLCDIKERNQSGINTVLDQNLSTLICANETTTHNV